MAFGSNMSPHINPDTSCSRDTDLDTALVAAQAWTSPWSWVISQAPHICFFLATVMSPVLLLHSARSTWLSFLSHIPAIYSIFSISPSCIGPLLIIGASFVGLEQVLGCLLVTAGSGAMAGLL